MPAPESLLKGWLGERFNRLADETIARPIVVPYDHLADIDGWTLTVPNDRGLAGVVPPPGTDEETIAPMQRIATAMLIAADYAIRWGAHDAASAKCLLERECPIAFVSFGPSDDGCGALLDLVDYAGITVLRDTNVGMKDLRSRVHAFDLRSSAHAADITRRHDPVFSFQTVVEEDTIGGTSRSSFIVHNAGNVDRVSLSGELGTHVGIEIGLSGDEITVERSAEIERLAATIPSFLEGVSSLLVGHTLRMGWRSGDTPNAADIGEVLRVWLNGLTGVTAADVRIVFASQRGRTAVLAEMGTRAAAFRRYREAVIAGVPNPRAAVHRKPLDGGD